MTNTRQTSLLLMDNGTSWNFKCICVICDKSAGVGQVPIKYKTAKITKLTCSAFKKCSGVSNYHCNEWHKFMDTVQLLIVAIHVTMGLYI